MKTPVVISHSGDDEYFKAVVIIAAQKNPVFVIGDSVNQHTFKGMQNIQHIHNADLQTKELEAFDASFINYSSNSREEEFRCFRRVFLVQQFMHLNRHEQVFHLDSDCLLLEDVSKLFPAQPATPATAYALMPNYYPYLMAGCIHNALLSSDFCQAFAQLCADIYISKSKFSLIEPKINWHRENNIGGGICDMTMYYLLHAEKIVSVLDLNQAYMIEKEVCIFDHNINVEFGPAGNNTFTLANGLKKVLKNNDKYYCETKDGSLIRALTLHFQGAAKRSIKEVFTIGNF